MSTAVLRAFPARYLRAEGQGGAIGSRKLRQRWRWRREGRSEQVGVGGSLSDEAVAVALWHAVDAAVGFDAGNVAARDKKR